MPNVDHFPRTKSKQIEWLIRRVLFIICGSNQQNDLSSSLCNGTWELKGTPPNATPLENKALRRPYYGMMVVNNSLIRASWGGGIEGY